MLGESFDFTKPIKKRWEMAGLISSVIRRARLKQNILIIVLTIAIVEVVVAR